MADKTDGCPGLTVNLVTGIPAPDLIADGLDVVIRVGALQDSSLFSRRLGAMPMVVCAAKSYLAQFGEITHKGGRIKTKLEEFAGKSQ